MSFKVSEKKQYLLYTGFPKIHMNPTAVLFIIVSKMWSTKQISKSFPMFLSSYTSKRKSFEKNAKLSQVLALIKRLPYNSIPK